MIPLVGQLEDELELSVEEVHVLLGAVSDYEDSEDSIQPPPQRLCPYVDGPWNDRAERGSAAASSSNAPAANRGTIQSNGEEDVLSPGTASSTEVAAFSLFATWRQGDSVSEEEYSPRVRRRFRQLVDQYEARSERSTSSMARIGN